MTNQPSNTAPLNRRKVFSIGAALAFAGVSPVLDSPVVGQDSGADDERIEKLKKPYEILGRALAESRFHLKTTNQKQLAGVFSVSLEGDDYLQFMSAALAGVVFAGLKTPEEIVAMLEKNIAKSKKA